MLSSQLRMNFLLLWLAAAAMAQTGAFPVVEDTTLANNYIAKAKKCLAAAQHDSSIFYFEKAGSVCENLARQRDEVALWQKYVLCLNGIGDNLWRTAKYDSAKTVWNKAIKIGLIELGENHPEVAASYYYLGSLYRDTGDYENAAKYLNQALEIWKKSLGENHIKVAISYNSLGILHHFKGDYEKALEYFSKAQAIRINSFGENHPTVALGYSNMGNVFNTQGDYHQAIEYYKKSLALRLQLLGENHPEVGDCYSNLGDAYLRLRDYDQAIACLDKSLALWKQVYGENHPDLALCYTTLAEVFEAQGDHEKAFQSHEKALTLRLNSLGKDHADVAQSYYNLGSVQAHRKKYNDAMANFSRALEILQKAFGGHHPHLAHTYQKMAQLRLEQNNFAEAIAFAQKSIMALAPYFKSSDLYANPPLRNISSEVDLITSLSLKAQGFEKLFSVKSHNLKDAQASLSTYGLASELIDKLRSGYKTEGSRLILGEKAQKLYALAIQTAFQVFALSRQSLDREQAFLFAEKSKAAVLTQSLQESEARQFAGIRADLREKERALRVDLAFYETEIQKEKRKTENRDSLKIRDFESRFFARKREYEKLLAKLEKSYPQYFALKYKTQTAAAPELQKALDDQTAVVEYFLGDSAIYAFAVTRNDLAALALPKDSTFSATVIALANSFKNETSKTEYLASATQLYHRLIKPLEPYIAAKPKWVIIPDDELCSIPFEALLNETTAPNSDADYRKLSYLFKQHEIAYHFSATLFLQRLQERPAVRYADLFAGFAPVFSEKSRSGNLFTLALPGFTAAPSDAHRYLVTRDGKTMGALEHSEQEVQNILAVFFNRGRNFLYQEASEENFKEKIKGYKYVHLATHGRIVDAHPRLSNLAFSQPREAGAKEDGILYSAETYNLDLNADLLVLSACQTGAGQIVKGEGLMGLTRGFLYSGARNIVASLWKVYDQHTSLLMVEMYRQIAAGKSYAAALREAKLKMIANAETAGPQSWAGFVLIGR